MNSRFYQTFRICRKNDRKKRKYAQKGKNVSLPSSNIQRSSFFPPPLRFYLFLAYTFTIFCEKSRKINYCRKIKLIGKSKLTAIPASINPWIVNISNSLSFIDLSNESRRRERERGRERSSARRDKEREKKGAE